MTATEYVVLVDTKDQAIGLAEKLEAHEKNLLHRAFSVFLYRIRAGRVEILLQQRALSKYHSAGLWTNTCCSHPRAEEGIVEAGERRLREELDLEAKLRDLGWFHYNAHFVNGLSENEIDHVLLGELDWEGEIVPNPTEVNALRWVELETLRMELRANPELFTPWLEEALELVGAYLESL